MDINRFLHRLGHILKVAFLKVVKKVDGKECTRESTLIHDLEKKRIQVWCQIKAPAHGALYWHLYTEWMCDIVIWTDLLPPPKWWHILKVTFLKAVKKLYEEKGTRESTSTRHLEELRIQVWCQLKTPANVALIWHIYTEWVCDIAKYWYY